MSDIRITSLLTDGAPVIEIQERSVGPRRALVSVVGEVDHSTHALFRSALARTWETQPIAVAVDLRGVTFLNAGGLRTLLLASGTARVRGVPLLLQAGPGQVTRLLTMVGLSEQLSSPSEVRAVLAAGSRGSRPVLRLVAPADTADDPRPPAAAARVLGPAARGVLRSVSAPRPALGDRGADDPRTVEPTVARRGARGPAAADRRARLRHALRSHELVGRATGMLMQRDGITADQALDVLTDASKDRNQSLVVVAEELTGTPSP